MQPAGERRLPLFPLFIVVVLVGLALGAFLSQHFSARSSQVAIRPATAAPLTTPTPLHRMPLSFGKLRTPTIKPSRKPLPTPSVSASSSPSMSPAASPSTALTPRPVHRVALATPKPTAAKPVTAPVATPVPQKLAAPLLKRVPVAVPAAPTGADSAAAVARDYLAALMRGDNRTANSDLGKSPNSLPEFAEQSFLSPSSRITDVRATPNGDGSYKVEAEVASPHGTYYVTFQVSRNVITDHYAIRVQ